MGKEIFFLFLIHYWTHKTGWRYVTSILKFATIRVEGKKSLKRDAWITWDVAEQWNARLSSMRSASFLVLHRKKQQRKGPTHTSSSLSSFCPHSFQMIFVLLYLKRFAANLQWWKLPRNKNICNFLLRKSFNLVEETNKSIVTREECDRILKNCSSQCQGWGMALWGSVFQNPYGGL